MADAKLNKDVFGLSVDNHELVKLAYDVYLANSRSSHAKTLKRGEVRGGGILFVCLFRKIALF